MLLRHTSPGFTLVELLAALVLLGVLASLAGPRLDAAVQRGRVRAVTRRVAADLYLARATAARTGRVLELRFAPPTDGCVPSYALVDPQAGRTLREAEVRAEAPGVCLTVSGSRVIRIDARGMPSGAARKIRARLGRHGDSISLSLVGRLYRWEHAVRPGILHGPGRDLRPPAGGDPRRPGADRYGFTLIEVLASMLILAVGLLGLEALGIGAARSIARAERQSELALVASRHMERRILEVRAAPEALAGGERCGEDEESGHFVCSEVSSRAQLAALPVNTARVRVSARLEPRDAAGFELVSHVYDVRLP